jgi:hypothetical protein
MKTACVLLLSAVAASAAPVPVKIVPGQGILRDGKPYFVKGAGGTDHLTELQRCGGNSIRTWSTDGLREILDVAERHGLTVCSGIWLEPECSWFSYSNPEHCARQMKRVTESVREFRDHPALLFWGLGNESEGDGTNAAYWKQINALAQMVRREDPAHPTFTAVAGLQEAKAAGLNAHGPDLDFVGINTYGALPGLREHLKSVQWTRPWVVTEYGARGFWERPKTAWGAPLEQTSGEKAMTMKASYLKAIAPGGDCWGGYAFLWGQKQEATATWFGLFTKEGERTAIVNVLEELWTGKAPANRTPEIANLKLSTQELKPGQTFTGSAGATDPENDTLTWHWSVSAESAGRDANGRERVPPVLADSLVKGGSSAAEFRAPEKPGAYRVFLRVTDRKGNAATGNVPVRVNP